MMESKRRNHLSIVIEKSFGGFIALFLILVTQREDIIRIIKELQLRSMWYMVLVIFGVLLIFGVVFLRNFLVWRKTYIWVENNTIIVERNTFFHKKNMYQMNHISNIDLDQDMFQQAIGTCTIKIDTNSSMTANKTDIKIVFSMADAEAFKAYILGEETSSIQEKENEDEFAVVETENEESPSAIQAKPLVRFTKFETLRNAMVNIHPMSILVILGLIGAVLFIALEGRGNGQFGESWKRIMGGAVATLLAIGRTLYNNFKRVTDTYDFQVNRDKNRIFIEQGLYNRSRKTIPIEKINAITVKQPFFARVFGVYQVELVNVGMGNDEEENSYLLLACKRDRLKEYMDDLLPEYKDLVEQELKRPSRLYYLHSLYSWIIPLLCAIGIGYYTIIYRELLPSIVFYSGVVIFIVAYVVLTILKYLASGYVLRESYMSISRGIFTRTVTMISYDHIQNVGISRRLISHMTGLCDVSCSIIADAEHTMIEMPLVTEEIGNMVARKMMESTHTYKRQAML